MDGSNSEQQTGLLYIKLERLGFLHEECKEWSAAATTYTHVIRSLFRSGLLQAAIAALSSGNDSNSSAEGGNWKIIARAIGGYYRSSLQLVSGDSAHDLDWLDEDMDPEIRGCILEIGLDWLSRDVKQRESSRDTLVVIKSVIGNLLDLYDESSFPLRRLRTQCSALECLPRDITESLFPLHETRSLDVEVLGYDRHLSGLKEHLLARWNALSAVRQRPNMQLLQSALNTWTAMLPTDTPTDWTYLQSRCGNVATWLDQLDGLSNCLHALGFSTQRAFVLHLIIRILEAASPLIPEALVSKAASLVLQLTQLSCMHEARTLLLGTAKDVEADHCQAPQFTAWHIANASYLSQVGEICQAEESLKLVERHPEQNNDLFILRSGEYDPLLLRAQFLYTSASVLFAKGHVAAALYYARSSSRLLHRVWAFLERGTNRSAIPSQASSPPNSSTASVNNDHVDTNAAQGQKNSTTNLKRDSQRSSSFWPVVAPLLDSLLLVSRLLAHEGMLAEALYYVGQAMKIADGLSTDFLKARVFAQQGELTLRAGQLEEAADLLRQSRILLESSGLESDRQLMLLKTDLVISQSSCLGPQFDECLINETYKALGKVNAHTLLQPGKTNTSLEDLTDRMQKVNLNVDSEQSARSKRGKSRITPKPSSRIPANVNTMPLSTDIEIRDLSLLKHLRGRLIRLKMTGFMESGKLKQAAVLLEEADLLPKSRQDAGFQLLQTAELQLRNGLQCLQLDPVLSIITESTLAEPCVVTHQGNEKANPPKSRPSKRKPRDPLLRSQSEVQVAGSSELTTYFSKCFQACNTLPGLAHSTLSTYAVHRLSNVLAKSLISSAAVAPSLSVPNIGSGYTAFGIGESTM